MVVPFGVFGCWGDCMRCVANGTVVWFQPAEEME